MIGPADSMETRVVYLDGVQKGTVSKSLIRVPEESKAVGRGAVGLTAVEPTKIDLVTKAV